MASEEDTNVEQNGFNTKPGPIVLSEEEVAVLKDCRRQSLYFRGLPLGIISALITRQIAHSGYFPRVAKWSGLYYSGSFMLGVLSGVASYRRVCMEKIMKLEHSTLADQFREFEERRRAVLEGRKAPPRRHMPANQPHFSPSQDVQHLEETQEPEPAHDATYERSTQSQRGLSYEELRNRHRRNVKSQPQELRDDVKSESVNDDESSTPASNDGDDFSYIRRRSSQRSLADEFRDDYDDTGALQSSDSPKSGFRRTNKYGDPID